MALDFKTKFEELFGDEIMEAAPTLRDVSPGLVGAAEGQVKEMNTRRGRVSRRGLRSGRAHSTPGGPQVQSPTAPAYAAPEYPAPTRGDGGADSGYAGDVSSGQGVYGRGTGQTDFYAAGRQSDGSFVDDGSIAMARGGDLASQTMGQLGKGALSTGLATAQTGLLMGSGIKDVIGPSIGAGLGTLTGIGAANTLAGAVVGSEIGTGVAESYAGDIDMLGGPYAQSSDRYKAAQEQARLEATAPGGLAQMGIEGAGSLLGLNQSPVEQSDTGFRESLTNQDYQAAQQAGTAYTELDKLSTSPSVAALEGQQFGLAPEEPGLLSGITDVIPSMKEMGFVPPTPQAAADARMSQYGDKGVLEKTSSQQAQIKAAEIKALEQQYSQLATAYNRMGEKARDNRGASTKRRMNEAKAALEKATGAKYSASGNQYTGWTATQMAPTYQDTYTGGIYGGGSRSDGNQTAGTYTGGGYGSAGSRTGPRGSSGGGGGGK